MDIKFKGNVEGICPVCGADALEYLNNELDLPYGIKFDYECQSCHHYGTEYYGLNFAGHTIYDEESQDNIDVNEYIPVGEEE